MKRKYAQKIVEDTKRNYNLIAEDFSRTRSKLWPELDFLAGHVKDGDRVLDLGCGNGRLTVLFKDKNIEYIGVDISEKLIEIAKDKFSIYNFQFTISPKFMVADGLNLPFPDNYFDKVFSIAVLHHLPSKKLRAKFVKEAHRVLKKNGYAFFTVWNLWQKTGFSAYLKNFILKIFGLSKLDFGDVFITWGKKANRYFHAFTKGELKNLFAKNNFIVKKVGKLFRKSKKDYNYFIIAKK